VKLAGCAGGARLYAPGSDSGRSGKILPRFIDTEHFTGIEIKGCLRLSMFFYFSSLIEPTFSDIKIRERAFSSMPFNPQEVTPGADIDHALNQSGTFGHQPAKPNRPRNAWVG
jgi:hypothetical protein